MEYEFLNLSFPQQNRHNNILLLSAYVTRYPKYKIYKTNKSILSMINIYIYIYIYIQPRPELEML